MSNPETESDNANSLSLEESQSEPNYQAEVEEGLGVELPDKLAKWMRYYKPGENYQRHLSKPVWRVGVGRTQETLADADPEKVKIIKEALLKVPMVHASREAFEGQIQPHVAANSENGSTFRIDQSLGLDECTFYHWGPFRFPRYGDVLYLVDPKILFDKKTFVTPGDIAGLVGVGEDGDDFRQWNFESIPDPNFSNITGGYHAQLVSGPEWLDLVARKIAMGEESAMLTQWGLQMGGEIKYHGTLPREYIVGQVESDEKIMQQANQIKTEFEAATGVTIPYKELKRPWWLA